MNLEELKSDLIKLDVNSLRARLAEDEKKIKNLAQILINEFFSSSLIDRSSATNCQRKDMSYVIVDYFRSQPMYEALLDQALYAAVIQTADCIVVDVLIQSGANMFQLVHMDDKDKMLYNVVRDDIGNDQLFQVIDKYFPSLLHAIEGEDIKQVRRLINYWCATDIQRCGKTMLEIAISSENEDLIRLISGVEYTMKLVHYILAGNANSVERLLNEHCSKIKLDFRNMSDNGAPILYYAIKSKNAKIIQLLMEKGCKLFSLMRLNLNSDVEIPVFFSALISPQLPPAVMQALLSQTKPGLEEILYQMTYKSQNALEVAIENDLNLESFQILVNRCGPKLIADRNQNCLTARDFAIKINKPCYASIIDDYVSKCVAHISLYKDHIQTFSLWGYDFSNLEPNQINLEFLEKVKRYQSQIASLSKCIEDGDSKKFYFLTHWKPDNEDEIFQTLLCWDGRSGQFDPLPMLHKAVIFNRPQIVNIVITHMPRDQSIDTLLDIYRRTAMHYAYASVRFAEIRKIFRFAGSSDHSLDKFGKEPLDFRDNQYHHLMPKLLYRLREKKFDQTEPNVWSEEDVINDDSKIRQSSLCFLN